MKGKILPVIIFFLLSANIFAQTKEARKIDEFGPANCCDYGARLDSLMIELINSPGATGYVFIYEGDVEEAIFDKNYQKTGTKLVPSEIGAAKELTGFFKNQIGFRNFPSERIIFIEAGFRERFTTELWFVPDGANPPEPKPTLKKIKQRKPTRKPFGFCGGI